MSWTCVQSNLASFCPPKILILLCIFSANIIYKVKKCLSMTIECMYERLINFLSKFTFRRKDYARKRSLEILMHLIYFFSCFYFCFYKGGHWCQSLTRWVTLVKFKPLPNLLTLQLHLQYQDITSLTSNFLLIEKVNESICEKIEKKLQVLYQKTSHNVVFPLKYVILTEFTWK